MTMLLTGVLQRTAREKGETGIDIGAKIKAKHNQNKQKTLPQTVLLPLSDVIHSSPVPELLSTAFKTVHSQAATPSSLVLCRHKFILLPCCIFSC